MKLILLFLTFFYVSFADAVKDCTLRNSTPEQGANEVETNTIPAAQARRSYDTKKTNKKFLLTVRKTKSETNLYTTDKSKQIEAEFLQKLEKKNDKKSLHLLIDYLKVNNSLEQHRIDEQQKTIDNLCQHVATLRTSLDGVQASVGMVVDQNITLLKMIREKDKQNSSDIPVVPTLVTMPSLSGELLES